MGSFNVACGISNIAIDENDEVGFVILRRDKDSSGKNRADKNGLAYYTFPTDVFKPFLAPVFGRYGDYGSIGNIEASGTATILESIFHRPVEDVLACITSDDHVYSHYSRIYGTYFDGNKEWDEPGIDIAESLSRLGFKRDMKSLGAKSKSYIFDGYTLTQGPSKNHSDMQPTVEVWSIANQSTGATMLSGFYARDARELMEKFAEATGKYPGFKKEEYKAVALLNDLYGMFFLKEVYMKMRESVVYRALPPGILSLTDRWDIVAKEMEATEGNDFMLNEDVSYSMYELMHDLSFPKKMRSELRAYGKSYELLEIHRMMDLMRLVNRMFGPTVCGTQHGDNAVSSRLNAVTDEILTKRMEFLE